MIDLSLIPLDDLIKEIDNRHDCYVLAMCRHETGGIPLISTYWKDDKLLDNLGLCIFLTQDVFRNEPDNEV